MINMNKKDELVSIVMPAYNAEKYISESIESVLNQTYRNFELIIVNDCSNDNTEKIILNYKKKDKRITYIKNEINKGVGESRNVGVQNSIGNWIAFIDSDDLWSNNKIEKQMKFIKNDEKIKFTYTGSSFINKNGKSFNYDMRVPKKVDYKTLLKQNTISCSSVLISKKLILNYEMPRGYMHEDYATWLTILKVENYAYGIDEPLLFYRIMENSKSGNKIKAAKMNWNTYKFVGLNFFARIYYMCFYCIKGLKKYGSIKNGGMHD